MRGAENIGVGQWGKCGNSSFGATHHEINLGVRPLAVGNLWKNSADKETRRISLNQAINGTPFVARLKIN